MKQVRYLLFIYLCCFVYHGIAVFVHSIIVNFAGFLETERLVYTLQCCKSGNYTMNNNKTSKPTLKLSIFYIDEKHFNNSALVNL